MSYQNSKSFTSDQKDMRMVVKSIVARQEAKGWPVKPYLTACVNFDVDFIAQYDSKIQAANEGAETKTQLFWENIRSNVEAEAR